MAAFLYNTNDTRDICTYDLKLKVNHTRYYLNCYLNFWIFPTLQCTGVAVESLRQSNWCCFFTTNPIGVKSGSNVLIHKPEVKTRCLFGFDPETSCAQCLSSRQYHVIELAYVSNGFSYTVTGVFLNIVLSGDLCAQIGGTCYGLLHKWEGKSQYCIL